MTPLFHGVILKDTFALMRDKTNGLLSKLTESSSNSEIEPLNSLSNLTLEVIISAVFGGDFDVDWMQKQWAYVYGLFIPFCLNKLLFGYCVCWLPLPHPIRLYAAVAGMKKTILDFVKKRKSDNRTYLGTDLLAKLLTVADGENEKIPDDQIVDEALTILFAGHDTLTSTLSWIIYFLAKNVDVQAKLRAEVDGILQRQEITLEVLPNLKYLKAVILESLRMRPPLPFIFRSTSIDSVICDKLIPKNTAIMLDLYAVHHDATYWKEPYTFKPDRFLDCDKENYTFIPFSAAHRNCIGQRFALQEAMVVIAKLMQVFTFSDPTEPTYAIEGIAKPLGLKVTLNKR